MKLKKRTHCLKPHEVAYLLLASSVITGCTQNIEKLPDYQQALDYCKNNPAYCQEKEKMDQLAGSGASGSFGPQVQTHHSGSSFLNYYLMYHIFFSNSGRVSASNYQSRFSNINSSGIDEKRNQYRGFGVYTPSYVNRMRTSIANGTTSFETASGKVYKSAKFAGSSSSGKSISRGGFGSSGRSFGVGS